jgi:hypothetical protein
MAALWRLLKKSLVAGGALSVAAWIVLAVEQMELPKMGRDTVLVYKAQYQDFEAMFIARIAAFAPNRYLEWEDTNAQGTVFIAQRDILDAMGYESSSLFVPGIDKKSVDTTTLWLSRKIFNILKEKKKAKCILDGVSAQLKYLGDKTIEIEVNRTMRAFPVILVADDRGSVRWFVNSEENPLLVRHQSRNYDQRLTSITTDRANTLRWIKGKKLENIPNQ